MKSRDSIIAKSADRTTVWGHFERISEPGSSFGFSIKRPTPEEMLERVREEDYKKNRGKLKIFLGAAPGVGKTFAMLLEGIEKRVEGVDVIVGLIETHNRKETERLVQEFEVIPRATLKYRGKTLTEFDLDAALKRRPTLILVDELAHTNVPGSRHTKRWQDIQELLDFGINVYTTVNILHLESVNDIVAQITGTRVRETIPDAVLEMADRIELIDLPPDNLIERLKEGKVYFPSQAELAAENFFRKGNLIALRELVLRTTANLVDIDVVLHRRDQAIKTMWPLSDRFLICVNPEFSSAKLIRAAKRLASHLKTGWVAILVDTPKTPFIRRRREESIRNLRLAESLGAETFMISGENITDEMITFLQENNISRLVINKHLEPVWKTFLFGNKVDDLIRKVQDVDIFILATSQKNGEIPYYPRKSYTDDHNIPWKHYGLAFLIVSCATLLNFLIDAFLPGIHLDTGNLLMIYLLGIWIIALQGYRGPAIFASILSTVFLDYFFIPPRFSLMVADVQYSMILAIMLIVSQVIGYLSIQYKRQTQQAQRQEKRTRALFALTRQLARTRGFENVLRTSAHYISDIFESQVQVCVADEHGKVGICVGYPKISALTTKERSIAQWVHDHGQMAGIGTPTLSHSDSIYLPLIGTRGTLGVVCVKPHQAESVTIPEQLNLLEALIHQIALALEVDQLQGEVVYTHSIPI
jgi:two-component system sensor histidine kinase KdpD